MTPSRFTQEFSRAIAASSPSARVAIKSDLELELSDATGRTLTAFLDNAYKEYGRDPKSMKEVIERYSTALLESRDYESGVDRWKIVPIIKDRQWLTEIAQAMKDRGSEPMETVSENLNDELIIVYAEDSAKNIHYLTPEKLDEIGVTQSELRALAIDNLRSILPKVEIHPGPLVSMVTAGGDYEASLLLLDEVWADFPTQGDIIVAVPSRDVLLVTGSRVPGGIARLRELATKSMQEASYRLTDVLFVNRNGRFIKFEGFN